MRQNSVLGFIVGPFVSGIFGVVIIPVTTWFYPAEDIGRLNVSQLALTFGVLICSLGLDQSYVREFHEYKRRAQLFMMCISPPVFALVLIGIFTLPFSTQIANWLFGQANPNLYVLSYASVASALLCRFFSLSIRMHERGLAYSVTQAFQKAFFLLSILIVPLSGNYKNFIGLQISVLSASVVTLFLTIYLSKVNSRQLLDKRFDLMMVFSLLRYGGPLIVSSILFWLLTSVSTILLKSYSTFSEIAIYSVAASFAGIVAIFQTVFSVIWAPLIYKYIAHQSDVPIIDIFLNRVLAVASVVFLLCGSFSWLAQYILPEKYFVVQFIILSAIAQPIFYTLSEMTGIGISISRRTVLSVWVSLAALLVSGAVGYLIIPILGAVGASIANATGFLIFLIMRTEISLRIWRKIDRTRLYWTISIGLFIAICQALTQKDLMLSIVCVLLLPIAFLNFRNEWGDIFRGLRNFFNDLSKREKKQANTKLGGACK